MINIRVPEEALSSDLALIPAGIYSAELTDIKVKLSKSSQQPVAWFIWTVTSDSANPIDEDLYPDLQGSTVGKKVLDSCSLQEKAIWRLNSVYKSITEENLPTEQDFSMEDFENMLKERLVGFSGDVTVSEEPNNNDVMQNRIDSITPTVKKKKRRK